jgi:glycosyltransferase involved in cell wall biosynthesis
MATLKIKNGKALVMAPSISVLITYYNECDLLTECLGSLRAQKRQVDEILVYDDASIEPAECYIPPGYSVRVIRGKVNRGPAYGRNVLLHASQSDYIHFHDADDLLHPDWYWRIHEAIEETRADAVFTEIASYSGDKLLCERVLGFDRLLAGEDLVHFCLRGAILSPAGTYRRSVAQSIGGYREALWQSEDFDFHVRLAASGIRYRVIVDPLVFIRIRPSGRSQNQLEVWTSAVEAIHKLSKELPQRYHHDLAEKAIQAGSVLFQLGAHSDARKAFQFARELGPPTFSQQRRLYRYVARTFGPEIAERAGMFYRRMIPGRFRSSLAKRGW